jgi:HEAT repeat protein
MDSDPGVRRWAVAACSGKATPHLAGRLAAILQKDTDARVRAEAAEILAEAGTAALTPLLAASGDGEGVVREAVATGLGEIEDPAAVPWLMEAAAKDGEKLVREAAVAALGAIGDERAIPLLLELVSDAPPQVRRRSVVALSVFDGPEIEAAIKAARNDRNPMVREAAEMVVGH